MKILSLKSVLLYQLGDILFSDDKTNSICFIDFLHDLAKSSSETSLSERKESASWRKIPIKKKRHRSQNASRSLYILALPQTPTAFSQGAVGTNPSDPFQAVVNRLNHARSNLKLKLINKQALCSAQTLPIEARLWLEFEIETQKPGWIAFNLSEKGLNIWLHRLCKQSVWSTPSQPTAIKPAVVDSSTHQLLWQVQYTHACCTRLLARDCIANPSSSASKQIHRFWPDDDAARSLVHTLMDTADALFWIPYQWPAQQYLLLLKRAAPLCQAFEHFHRVCLCESWQPYAELKEEAIALETHPQHLIVATRNILKVLLQERLGEIAPEKL